MTWCRRNVNDDFFYTYQCGDLNVPLSLPGSKISAQQWIQVNIKTIRNSCNAMSFVPSLCIKKFGHHIHHNTRVHWKSCKQHQLLVHSCLGCPYITIYFGTSIYTILEGKILDQGVENQQMMASSSTRCTVLYSVPPALGFYASMTTGNQE